MSVVRRRATAQPWTPHSYVTSFLRDPVRFHRVRLPSVSRRQRRLDRGNAKRSLPLLMRVTHKSWGEYRIAYSLSKKYELPQLLQCLHDAVFKRRVQTNPPSDAESQPDPTPATTHRDARPLDVLTLTAAAVRKSQRISPDLLRPAFEVLTATADTFDVPGLLLMLSVLSRTGILHTPLTMAVANKLLNRLSFPSVVAFRRTPDQQLRWLDIAGGILYGLRCQRLRHPELLRLLQSELSALLRDMPYNHLCNRDIKCLSDSCGSIFFSLSHLDFVRPESELMPLLNETLRGLAALNAVSIYTYALWANAILLAHLERFPVYRETLDTISVRITPLLSSMPLHVFTDREYCTDNGSASPPKHRRTGRQLHERLLRLIYTYRYLLPTAFEQLPEDTRDAFQRIQQLEIVRTQHPRSRMRQRMQRLLRQLRIAHHALLQRGPLLLDIVERDRALVWCCSSWKDYYVNTRERTALYRANERLLLAMGYNVAHVAHWQWGRLKAKRSRLELLRMARYYALRDRREFNPNFEGWLLPYTHLTARKAYAVQARGAYFPLFKPLGHTIY